MRIYIILVFSILTQTFAQTSIGFKDPQNTKSLLEYKLPTWGYHSSELLFDFSGNIHTDKTQYSYIGENKTQKYYNGFKNDVTNYTLIFRESEKYTVILAPRTRISYYFSNSQQTTDEAKTNSKGYSFTPSISLPFQTNYFFHPQHSIMTSGLLNFYYDEDRAKNTSDGITEKRTTVSRSTKYNIKIGYSFGRIRNVTPVIRALRFRERLNALSLSNNLSQENMTELAQHFAKYAGYRSFYDRSEKFFWDDLAGIAGLESMSPGNAFYLAETVNELIYDRYQGYAFSIGMDLIREYYHSSNGKKDHSHVGPFAQFEWYYNFNLRSQLSVDLSASYYALATGDTDNYDNKTTIVCKAEYNWMIADRTVWRNQIYYYDNKVESDRKFEGIAYNTDMGTRAGISTHIVQRFEDHIYLNAGMNFYYAQEINRMNTDDAHKITGNYFSYYVRLTYLFDRSMR